MENIGDYAFIYCSGIKELSLGESVKTIGNYSFEYNSKLEKVTVKGNLESVGTNIFYSAPVTELAVGEKVSSLSSIFYGMENLEKIEVAESNGTYSSQDGVLYNKEKTELIRYPQKKADVAEYEIPEGVEEIRNYGFYRNGNLQEVVFPESLKTIGDNVFYACESLTKADIPDGVESIGDYAFYRCRRLEELQISDFLKNIGSNVFEGCDNLVVYCNANSNIADYAEKNGITYITSTHCINFNLKKKCAILPNGTSIDVLESINNYNVKIESKLIGKQIKGYHVNSNGIVLRPGTVSANETLVLSVISKKDETVAYSADIDLDEQVKADIDIVLQQKGYICTELKTSEKATVLIYNSNGKLCEVLNGKGKCISNFLNQGNYQIVYVQGESYQWSFQDINEFYNNEFLQEDKDYIVKNVEVLDGIITDTGEVQVPDIDTEQLRYLDSDKCIYSANVDHVRVGGLVTLRVQYSFKEYRKSEINNIRLRVMIPESCNYVANSMLINGKVATNVTESDSDIQIPLEEKEGVICFNVKPIEYGNIESMARIEFRASRVQYVEIIDTVKFEMPFVTLECPETITEKTVNVSGLTLPNTTVGIYDCEKRVGTAFSNKSGHWNKKISIYDAADNSVHDLQAKINIGSVDEQSSDVVTVAYSPKAVTIKEFIMYYNNHSSAMLNLLDIANKSKPVVSFNPAYPFTFTVKLSNSDTVDTVYIVSTKNGSSKSMKALYDKTSDTWIASGYFDGNKSYVPGVISVKIKGVMENYEVSFQAEEEQQNEEVPDTIKNGSCKVMENSYDERTETGIFSGTYTLDDEDKTEVDFSVSNELVDSKDYAPDNLTKDGYLKIKTDDESSTYYTKVSVKDDNAYVTETIRFKKQYYEDPKYGKTFKEVAYSKLVSEFIDKSDGAIPGISLAQKVWKASKTAFTIEGFLIKMDYAQQQLIYSSYSDGTARLEALQKLQTAYWMYLTGRAIIKGAKIYTSIQFPIVGSIVNLGLGFATSYFYAYIDDWFEGQLNMILDCDVRWSVDPSGYVYEAVQDNRLEGVKVTIYYQDEEGKETEWDASEYDQMNPLITDSSGEYAWDVPEGLWRVKFEKEGYQTVYSEWLPVPPIQLGINIGMVSLETPQVQNLELYKNSVIVAFDKYMKVDSVRTDTFKVKNVDGTQMSGKIEAIDSDDTSGVMLAKQFKIVFDEELKPEDYEIELDKAISSYSGVTLGETITKRQTIQELIEDIEVELQGGVQMNETIDVPIKLISSGNIYDYEVICISSMDDIAEVMSVDKIDSQGIAYAHVKCKLPGNVSLKVGVKGLSIQKEIILNIEQQKSDSDVIKGDVNSDGSVDIQDLRKILRYVCGKEEFSTEEQNIADVNTDNVVNIQDLRIILRYVCGKNDAIA